MTSSNDRKKVYADTIDRAMKWILSHQEKDGSFGDIVSLSHYMALGASLHFNGCDDEGARLMPFIKKTYVADNGDFLPPAKEAALRELYYAPGWAIYSAHLCSAEDISMPAVAHLLKFQDPKTGGLFGSAQAHKCGKGIIHPASTCLGGLAALVTGHVAEASRMADHVVDNLIAKNPDLNNAFYPAWDTESGLYTDEDLPLSTNMPRVVLRNEPGQHHFLTGMMIMLLSKVYEATKDSKYLDGALAIYDFCAGGSPAIYENTLSHKFAWGCALLYGQTGRAEHLESACRMCDYLASIQEADGTFVHLGTGMKSEDFPYSPRMGVTSQFALWLRLTVDLL